MTKQLRTADGLPVCLWQGGRLGDDAPDSLALSAVDCPHPMIVRQTMSSRAG